MLLKYFEELAIESLDGRGIAYTFDAPYVLKYALLIFLAHLIIYAAIKRNRFSAKTYFPRFCFAFYFVILMCFTVLPIDFPGINGTEVDWNFSLKPILYAFSSRTALINFAGNIMLFVPIVILGMISRIKVFDKWSGTLLFSLFVSMLIEFIQYFEASHGYTDIVAVDIVDIITNVIGGIVGWFIVKFYRKNHIETKKKIR